MSFKHLGEVRVKLWAASGAMSAIICFSRGGAERNRSEKGYYNGRREIQVA